jgi:hypothetical protein
MKTLAAVALSALFCGCSPYHAGCNRGSSCGPAPWVCMAMGNTEYDARGHISDCVGAGANYAYCHVPCTTSADCKPEYGGTRCGTGCSSGSYCQPE